MRLDEPTLPQCQGASVSLDVPGLPFGLCGEDSLLRKANNRKKRLGIGLQVWFRPREVRCSLF